MVITMRFIERRDKLSEVMKGEEVWGVYGFKFTGNGRCFVDRF